MNDLRQAKPFSISKREVLGAWERVKSNRGAAGVDKESLAEFEAKLSKNLYKLWNRMSSGSYFPQPVRRVEIPKRDGKVRPLGIPTVSDRVAQTVVRARLEKQVEPLFHEDSYGYRPGKSAIAAVRVCRERNWKQNWVLDIDIEKFFDTIDHELMMRAVRKHCKEAWEILYIERWLKAPIQHADGRKEASERGTPQGGVISTVLANLYLHYAFDAWMVRRYPSTQFERYADDMVVHCNSETQAQELKRVLIERFAACGLSLNPEKTQIVYCKDSRRKEEYPNISYTFLGYTFQPRKAKSRYGKGFFTSFLPAASQAAQKRLAGKLKEKNLRQCSSLSAEEVAGLLAPVLNGWFNYFLHFYPSVLRKTAFAIDCKLTGWIINKYRLSKRRAVQLIARMRTKLPQLFAHWRLMRSVNG
jgi:RNA-directed DNA polymerase